MAGWTNRGKFLMLQFFCEGLPLATLLPGGTGKFQAVLLSNAAANATAFANGPDINTFGASGLVEVTAGTGYTSGGIAVARNATEFLCAEDDALDIGSATFGRQGAGSGQLIWTPIAPPTTTIPDIRWLIMTDDAAVVANRVVFAWWDLGGPHNPANPSTFTINTATLRATE